MIFNPNIRTTNFSSLKGAMMLFRAAFLILFLFNAIAFSADTGAFKGRVIGVLDGDTIEVLKDKAPVRIRLFGIDSPERDQDFGTRARQFTSNKVFRKTVEVVPVEKDQYNRLVAKVYIDGKYLNQMIVAEGFAWWYKRCAPKDVDLRKAEDEARAAKIGLWSHPRPIPPWKFRRQKASTDGGNQRQLIQNNSPFASPKLVENFCSAAIPIIS
jgi:micrococcal nuclease